MKSLRDLLLVVIGATVVAYAGTTLRDQDFPSEYVIVKHRTAAQLRLESCPTVRCVRYNTTDYDLYTSTGSGGAGMWRNTRLGTGP